MERCSAVSQIHKHVQDVLYSVIPQSTSSMVRVQALSFQEEKPTPRTRKLYYTMQMPDGAIYEVNLTVQRVR